MKRLLFCFLFLQISGFCEPNLLIMGAPGAGKGTLIQSLVSLYPYQHVSVGDLLRKEIKEGSLIGLDIKEKVANGDLIETSVLFPLVRKFIINGVDQKKLFILDGLVQSEENIEFFDQLIKELGIGDSIAYIYLETDYDVALQRLAFRYCCAFCAYIVSHENQQIGLRCPRCEGFLEKRLDDNYEIYRKRLDRFYYRILPLVQFYEKKPNFFRVNANDSISNVLKKVVSFLDFLEE